MEIVRVVDLSREITAETVVYPGDPVPHIAQHATIARDGFNLVSVQMGSQTGTHVDAPFHFDDDTEKIDEIPLDRFVGRGVILHCDGVGPRERITLEAVRADAEQAGPGDIVLVHTGWARHYGEPAYFDNPFLDAGLVSFLLDRGVRTIGLDALNIDETPDDSHPGEGFPAHHLIANVGGVICENLCNLESIDFADPFVSLLPMKFVGIDGAPVRAVAMEVR
jgi:kynurenine formamidase